MTYIRLRTSDTWHWMPACWHVKRWRDSGQVGVDGGTVVRVGLSRFDASDTKPTSGEMCNACRRHSAPRNERKAT